MTQPPLALIIDGNNILIRAHGGMSHSNLTTSDGTPSGGLYGTIRVFITYMQRLNPTHVLWCWDSGRSVFRTGIRADYKGNRGEKAKPGEDQGYDELLSTFQNFGEFLDLVNVAQVKKHGVEADDWIAQFVHEHKTDLPIVVLSADHDVRQLITHPASGNPVSVLKPSVSNSNSGRKALKEKFYTYDSVIDEYKLPPHRLPELWAIQGDCQPSGTMVTVKRSEGWYTQIPIEDVEQGEKVLSRCQTNGWKLESVEDTEADGYEGDLVKVQTESGLTSRYTPKHRCMASLGETEGMYCTYLMRKGKWFRVGTSRLGDRYGFLNRLGQEGADSVWVLSVHSDKEDCLLQEQILSYEYNIPDLVFVGNERVQKFWNSVGDLTGRAVQCLTDHGRLISYPYYSPSTGVHRTPSRYLNEVRACNLISGMRVCTPGEGVSCGEFKSGESHSIIHVSREWYNGEIHRLRVSGSELYVADRILTHNSTDNIKGVPGLGPVRALAALAEFGSLDQVITHHPKLAGLEKQIHDNYRMIRLPHEDMESLPFPLSHTLFDQGDVDQEALKAFFYKWEMNSFLLKMTTGAGLWSAVEEVKEDMKVGFKNIG